ncbi:MAG: low affinity iron permease family protein [Opitutus sp.]
MKAPLPSQSRFTCFAKWTAHATGRPAAFFIAVLVILAWAITGPLFHYSDTWQLIINTGTTVVTFLMVFLIQNTQNRDSQAIHVKLDELIRSIDTARNSVLDLDALSDAELEKLRANYAELAASAQIKLETSHGRKVSSRAARVS